MSFFHYQILLFNLIDGCLKPWANGSQNLHKLQSFSRGLKKN
jgi:hypothetical protein